MVGQLPIERGEYIQTIMNPFDLTELITVQRVKRQLFLRNQSSSQNQAPDSLLKTFFQDTTNTEKTLFLYENMQSSGPLDINSQCDDSFQCGNGIWTLDIEGKENENRVTQMVKKKSRPRMTKLYEDAESYFWYILAFWKYDEAEDKLECKRNFAIYKPINQISTSRVVHVSEQAQCLFWFEKTSETGNNILYSEVGLHQTNSIVQTVIPKNDELEFLFKRQSYEYFLGRFTIKNEKILAYSVWEKTQAMTSSRGTATARGTASKIQDQEPNCVLKFYSLVTSQEVWKIDNADTVLQVDLRTGNVWVLGQTIDETTKKMTEQVSLLVYKSSQMKSDKSDSSLKNFIATGAQQNNLADFRLNQMKSLDIVFDLKKMRLTMLSGKNLVVFFDFDTQPFSDVGILLKKTEKTAWQFFISGNKDDIYLCELENLQEDNIVKTQNELDQKSKNRGKLKVYNISEEKLSLPLVTTFELKFRLCSNSMLQDIQYNHSLVINQDLQAIGGLISSDLQSFSFLRSIKEHSHPLEPQKMQWIAKYPLILSRSCQPDNKSLILQNLVQPNRVRYLDLGDWTFVAHVENRLQGGTNQSFTMLLLSPNWKVCFVKLKIQTYNMNEKGCIQWELVGILTPPNLEEIASNMPKVPIDNIICVKHLAAKNDEGNQAVLIQYENKLVAVHINTKCEYKSSVKNLMTYASSPQKKQTRLSARRGDFCDTEGEIFKPKYADDKNIIEEKQFGVHLCNNDMLDKLILLGKNGDCAYFAREDLNSSQQIVRIQISDLKKESRFKITIKWSNIFKLQGSKICFFDLDYEQEQRNSDDSPDNLYVLETSRKLIKLVPKHDSQFENEYRIQATKDLSAIKKLGLLIMNCYKERWPTMQISWTCLSYNEQTVCLHETSGSQQIIPTISGYNQVTQVRAFRDTMNIIGLHQLKTGALAFFVKPNLGSRAIDCLGINGPKPKYTQFINDDNIMYCWQNGKSILPSQSSQINANPKQKKQKNETSMHIYSVGGKYKQTVDLPFGPNMKLLEGFKPILCTSDQKYFLLKKKMQEKPGFTLFTITQLRNDDNYFSFSPAEFFYEIENEEKVFKTILEVKNSVQLITISTELSRDLASEIKGRSIQTELYEGNWLKISCKFRQSTNTQIQTQKTRRKMSVFASVVSAKEELQNEWNDPQIIMSGDYIVFMSKQFKILYVNVQEFKQSKFFEELPFKQVQLDLSQFVENQLNISEFGITSTNQNAVIQIQTPICLIKWDLENIKEQESLHNYRGCYDDEQFYVNTEFKIPANNQAKPFDFYIKTNPSQQILQSSRNHLIGRLYRLYTELNLYEIKHLEDKLESEKDREDEFDPSLVQCSVQGKSIFHMFFNKIPAIRAIHRILTGVPESAQVSNKDEDEDAARRFSTPEFKRAVQLLIRPGPDGKSALNLAIQSNASYCCDLMLSIIQEAQDIAISRFFLDDLHFFISNASLTAEKFFQQKFVITEATRRVLKVNWTAQENRVILASSHSLITREEVEKVTNVQKIQEITNQSQEPSTSQIIVSQKQRQNQQTLLPQPDEEEKGLKQVEVKMLDFDWLFQDMNAQTLIQLLSATENEAIFSTAQITLLIELFWQDYQVAIIWEMFAPFVRYFIVCTLYFTIFSQSRSDVFAWEFARILTIIALVIDILCAVTIELLQFQAEGFWEYISDLWNFIDWLSIILNSTVIIMKIFLNTNQEEIRSIASIALFFMWAKLFYWMRIFDTTAAFIRMLTQIILDVRAFFVMLLICITMFANATLILDQPRREANEGLINPEAIGVPWVDAIINQYLLGLGNSDTSNFSGQIEVWIVFILATIVIQLLFMNLLIAIMGDTFARVSADKGQSSMIEKCQMMNDFIWVTRQQAKYAQKKCVYIIDRVKMGGNQSTVWEGQIGKLKQVFKKEIKAAFSIQKAANQDLSLKLKDISEREEDIEEQIGALSIQTGLIRSKLDDLIKALNRSNL